MKKLFSIVALVAIALVITSCGGNSSTETVKTDSTKLAKPVDSVAKPVDSAKVDTAVVKSVKAVAPVK